MRNPLLKGLRPVHPGELLREDVLPALGLPKVRIAAYLGMSRQLLHEILDGKKPISTRTALRLGRLTGTTPESWLAMQASYDLAVMAPQIADELAQIPVLEAA